MAQIHYVDCDTTHDRHFYIDVPSGAHWLLVATKTPALFWVEGELREYPAHSAILYRPRQKVYYRACTDRYVNDWIRFESDEPYITESPLPYGVPFSLSDPDYCHKLFELLAAEHQLGRDYKELSIDCLLRTLFNKLLESSRQKNDTPHYDELLRLRAAIQHHPFEDWTVAKMASGLQISPGYLHTLYKKAFGVSCMDDVINSRIRLAKHYLILGSQSIAEISARCGYQNVEHFIRQFKQLTGQTPRMYQRMVSG